MMKILDIPWWNRPGFKLSRGKKLNDAELLAIILERGNRRDNAIDQANKLLTEYKSFSGLSKLSYGQLSKKVGHVKALKIKALFEIFRKTSKLQRNGFKPVIESAKDVFNLFVDDLKDRKKEYFYALLLDSKNKIIKDPILISVGTLNCSLIHPREVFKEAIRESAHAIILVHNHPSGDPSPSDEDFEVTEVLKKAGELLDIKVLDHVIIGRDNFKSLDN